MANHEKAVNAKKIEKNENKALSFNCFCVACKSIWYCISYWNKIYLSTENLPLREIKWDSNWKGKGPILCWDFYQPSNKQTKSTNHNYKNNIGRPAQFSKDKYEKYLNTFSGWLAVPKLPVY